MCINDKRCPPLQAVLRVLDKRGVLSQIRAQLRQEVFKAIDDDDDGIDTGANR